MRTKKLILTGLFTALIIVGSFIRIPFPAIPMTLQFAFVLLAGILLGPYLGLTSVFVYILLGLAGLPVFATGGGIGYVLMPSFGYILGFLPAVFLAGLITKTKAPTFFRLFTGSVVALAVTYFIGLIYFALIKSLYLGEAVSLWQLLYSQVLFMLPKDILLCILCSFLGKRLQFIIAMDKFK
jgi:biotin transport system substrate-specific component